MRPVCRGDSSKKAPLVQYQEAKKDLLARLDPYCSLPPLITVWVGVLMGLLLTVGIHCRPPVDERVYACSTSSECGAGWVCRCTGESPKGGQCVPAKFAEGIVGNCGLGMDTGDFVDMAEASDTTDAADSADVAVVEEGGSLDADGSIPADVPDWIETPSSGTVYVPGGTFWMGCNATKEFPGLPCNDGEKPLHEVTLSPYYIDTVEVTVSAYETCVAAGGCSVPEYVFADTPWCNYGSSGKGNHPINCVTWCQARVYCEWAGKRLPSEAEWELAARGSCDNNPGGKCQESIRIFPWGDQIASCEYAVMYENYYGCGDGGTMPVGSKVKGDSPYGVKDLAGNVWEWVEDCYGTYPASSAINPINSTCVLPGNDCLGGDSRVVRGGSFGEFARDLRVSVRYDNDPGGTDYTVGFRCARSLP